MTKLKYLQGATDVLKWAVLYPIDKENSCLKRCLYYIWALLFILSFMTADIQCVVFLLTNPFDLVAEGVIIMNAAIYITLFINIFILHSNSKNLVNLINNINNNFVHETDNEVELITMGAASNIADKLAYYWTMSVISSGIFAGTLPLISGNRNIMPIPGWFPYDHTKSPYYEVSYTWQMFCQINLGLIYGASDMIFLSVTINIGQQIKILSSNLRNNFYYALIKSQVPRKIVLQFKQETKTEDLHSLMEKYSELFMITQSATFKEINFNYLKKNIDHHELLLEYCEELNRILGLFLMNKVMMVTFNTIFIVFCFITSADDTLIVGLACYVFFGSAELFIYNYSGQILIDGADTLWTLYECPWYLCELKFQKAVLMVQMKINKSTLAKAGNYFTMCAPSFITFIKCVFSYATVLKEVTSVDKL